MKTGSIQLQTKGAEYSVDVVDENNKTIGSARLTLNDNHTEVFDRFENIVKLIIKK